MSTQVAEGAAPERGIGLPRAHRAAPRLPSPPVLAVAALTALGFTLRLVLARQSLFADELSTYWISAQHSLGGVLSLMYGTGAIKHAEITPPLYFLLAWLTSQFGHSAEWLRLPSLIAGTSTIPIVYTLGLRTVRRRAALVAAAATAVAPFMVYYSGDARAYAVMMLTLLVSTLSMVLALDTGRVRWWVLYAVSACAAFYSHYTSAFVLAAQLAWLWWAQPAARRRAAVATAAAAAGVVPWIPGLLQDLNSPTLEILNALSPFTFTDVRIDFAHWLVGYPETFSGSLTRLPGRPALVLFLLAAILAGAALLPAIRAGGVRAKLAALDRRIVLVLVLAVATPIAELILGALGKSVLSVRDLAASWPYLALAGGATLAAGRPRLAAAAAALALIAFAWGSAKMLGGDFQRPDYQGAASYVSRALRPGDVVVDETGALSPGPLTGFDVVLHQTLPIVRAEAPAERDHPFGFSDPIVPLQAAVDQAVAEAHGHRVFLVTNAFVTNIAALAGRINPAPSQFPANYHLTAERAFAGLGGTLVAAYAPSSAGAAVKAGPALTRRLRLGAGARGHARARGVSRAHAGARVAFACADDWLGCVRGVRQPAEPVDQDAALRDHVRCWFCRSRSSLHRGSSTQWRPGRTRARSRSSSPRWPARSRSSWSPSGYPADCRGVMVSERCWPARCCGGRLPSACSRGRSGAAAGRRSSERRRLPAASGRRSRCSLFATLLSVTRRSSLNAVPLALGAAILAGILVAHGRIRAPGMSRWRRTRGRPPGDPGVGTGDPQRRRVPRHRRSAPKHLHAPWRARQISRTTCSARPTNWSAVAHCSSTCRSRNTEWG